MLVDRSTPDRKAVHASLDFDPHEANSARLEDVDEPPIGDGSVLVEALALGVCGTDQELMAGHLGFLTPGRGRLILGHESLGRVMEAPFRLRPGSGRSGGWDRPDGATRPLPRLRRRRVGPMPRRAITPNVASSA